MPEDSKTQIRRLARELEAARQRFLGLGQMNTSGMSADERLTIAEELAMAQAEVMRLNRLLMEAQGKFAAGR